MSIRSEAESAASVVNWGTNFVVSFTFLTVVGALGRPGAFWLYAAIGLVTIWFILTRVPETRGRTLEEIQQQLAARS